MDNKIINLKRTEIVFGLVGAAGTNFKDVVAELQHELEHIGYTIEYIKLSLLIEQHVAELKEKGTELKVDLKTFKDKADRIGKLMNAGNELCAYYVNSEMIAVLAMEEIKKRRDKRIPEKRNVAYILKSLKRSEEVYALRQVYGPGFYLIGIYSSREKQKESLASEIAHSNNIINKEKFYPDAEKLILRDQEEPEDFGQEVRKTFHLSDNFISIEDQSKIETKVKRFVELVFGNPFHTPTKDEYAMFFAQAAALRSGALARQVGAAITSRKGEILSVGTNDVSCSGGGLYWVDSDNDQRDIMRREDSNTTHINLIIQGIAEVLEKNKMISVRKDEVIKKIKSDTYLANLTEFGRIVHAEMDAITQATRLGISLSGGILYTTLFPCQNCTKHIVATGIKKVIYIEPYPKSLAKDLHDDSIVIDKQDSEKVSFLPFEGIGPRRFQDLFSLVTSVGMKIERKEKQSGKMKEWIPTYARPRLPMSPTSYLDEEELRIKRLIMNTKSV